MNTLLPVADFAKAVEYLDDKRLGKQRSEVVTILRALKEDPPENGEEHPAVKMWRGNEQSLTQYGIAVCIEWLSRGNTDNVMKKIRSFVSDFPASGPPEWLGNEAFHESHRSFLLRSLPSHYRRFWPDLADDVGMSWPRSPERQRASIEEKQQEKLIKRAHKMKERAQAAIEDAHDAALRAGLDPDTLEPLSELEVDPELAAL